MDERWMGVELTCRLSGGEEGVEGCCHLFGWRTAWLIKQQRDRANLIAARRGEETRRRGAQGGKDVQARYQIIFRA